MSATGGISAPSALIPPMLHNDGMSSLGKGRKLVLWPGSKAEELLAAARWSEVAVEASRRVAVLDGLFGGAVASVRPDAAAGSAASAAAAAAALVLDWCLRAARRHGPSFGADREPAGTEDALCAAGESVGEPRTAARSRGCSIATERRGIDVHIRFQAAVGFYARASRRVALRTRVAKTANNGPLRRSSMTLLAASSSSAVLCCARAMSLISSPLRSKRPLLTLALAQ
jgi:hypothetical protein